MKTGPDRLMKIQLLTEKEHLLPLGTEPFDLGKQLSRIKKVGTRPRQSSKDLSE